MPAAAARRRIMRGADFYMTMTLPLPAQCIWGVNETEAAEQFIGKRQRNYRIEGRRIYDTADLHLDSGSKKGVGR